MAETTYPSFGCCSFWKVCQLGEGTCHYKVSNPAKMNACGAYNRHQKQPTQVTQNEVMVEIIEQPPKVEPKNEIKAEPKDELIIGDNGQLSLF